MSDELDGRRSVPDGSHHPGETLLRWVERTGLEVPAALLLELHRPLMPLAWSAAMLLGGVLAPLFGPDYYERIEALRDPRLLDRMLERLEASSRDPGGGE
jgi:hypothetical protein